MKKMYLTWTTFFRISFSDKMYKYRIPQYRYPWHHTIYCRKAGGSCPRVQGHDLLSHHGGVQRSKKVSSVQGCGNADPDPAFFSILPSWIRIQQLKLVRIHPYPQPRCSIFLFSDMVDTVADSAYIFLAY
jgi:hypothetical protein